MIYARSRYENISLVTSRESASILWTELTSLTDLSRRRAVAQECLTVHRKPAAPRNGIVPILPTVHPAAWRSVRHVILSRRSTSWRGTGISLQINGLLNEFLNCETFLCYLHPVAGAIQRSGIIHRQSIKFSIADWVGCQL
jgi:hypothetical protein